MTDYNRFLSRAAAHMQESAIRRMGTVLSQPRDIISFAPGYPAPETFPWQEFREITSELLSGTDGSVLQYGPTRGFRPLLETIIEIMEHRGVRSALPRLIVTTGSQQGLDLVARVLLDPDDIVLVELPTYTGAITAFRNVQARMVGVRQEADGIDLDHLEEVYGRLTGEGGRVRLLYVVPNFQNPTGLLIGLDKRRRLLDWAARRQVLILEDDPYRELYFGVEEQRVHVAFGSSHCCNRRIRARGCYGESRGRRFHEVPVTGPDTQLAMATAGTDRCKERGIRRDLNSCKSELAVRCGGNLSAKRVRHQLHSVADAKHRHRKIEHRRLAPRSAIFAHALRAAGENDAGRSARRNRRRRRVVRKDLAVDRQLAQAPGDELGEL